MIAAFLQYSSHKHAYIPADTVENYFVGKGGKCRGWSEGDYSWYKEKRPRESLDTEDHGKINFLLLGNTFSKPGIWGFFTRLFKIFISWLFFQHLGLKAPSKKS